jgi:hypothetical protein
LRFLCICAALAVLVVCAAAASEEPPDVSKYDDKSCWPCHASTRAVPGTWDAEGLLPEYDQSVFAGGTRIPLDTTALEFRVWQDVLSEKDDSKGDTCFTCHLADARGPEVQIPGAKSDIAELHRWLHVEPAWEDSTLGLWVDVDTYRTFLVATVKVLNYDSGHRVPVRGELRLRVKGLDAGDQPLQFMRGHTLPERIQKGGVPGFYYARTYGDADGKPVAEKLATQVLDDTRLHADEHDEHHYYFMLPAEAPRGAKAWEISAELVWVVDGKEHVLEKASADSPR